MYPKLAPVANTWMKVLNIERQFPDEFDELQRLCHHNNQTKPTVLILKYGKGGHNTLHQDLYGDIFFPIQLVLFLNEPDHDYTGGEFVLTQQTPRAQSKAIVLRPRKGDVLILTTNFRPVKGSKGYYRVQMKHGVSEVHNGDRHALGIIFHDALT
ncbi:MAG: 2OG-Fe(II) oxygenase [Candidatus Nitrosopolaris sp.]